MQNEKPGSSRPKVTPKRLAVTILLFFVGVSLTKLALYELSGAASCLRGAVGSEIVLLAAGTAAEPDTVKLEHVRYRWNDRLGFFDLELFHDRGNIGVSPFEAMDLSNNLRP